MTLQNPGEFVNRCPGCLDVVNNEHISINAFQAFKRTANIQRALAAGHAGLTFGIASPSNDVTSTRQTQCRSQQFRLIVTAPAFAFSMEGNGNGEGRAEFSGFEAVFERSSERPGQRHTIVVLEVVYQLTKTVVEQECRAPEIISGLVPQTGAAESLDR